MMKVFRNFYPDLRKNSIYEIDFNGLYKKGIRGLIFDIDNTLVPHGADADERIEKLFGELKKMGFKTFLLSNNKLERVKRFNVNIRSLYIYKAGKPNTANYIKAMRMMGTKKETTVFIGDQLFTDIWGAKKAGITSILLNPIDKKEEIQIVLKRYLEKIVLNAYEKERKSEG